jgi:hypothetical protein
MLSVKRIAVLFWLGAIIAIGAMIATGPSAWDTDVYWTAAQSLVHGGDPYAEGIAVQQAFHNKAVKDPHAHPPMTYVYSPMTLPVLRWIGHAPYWAVISIFGLLLALGFSLQLWAGWQMSTKDERRWLPLLLPMVAFFPGLLNDDVLLSGNIAYVLYGFVLAAAVPGWRRNRWGWFYVAVVVASCCKAPLLSLLALPVVVGRRQWLPAGAAGAAGLALFIAQGRLWPALFQEYLRAVQLQFDWNSDFGVGPAGIFGRYLVKHGMAYKTPTTAVYLCFAGIIGIVMLWIARRIHAVPSSADSWVPAVLVGTILLNPRVKEYDVAAITLPMFLIASRLLRKWMSQQTAQNQPRRSSWTSLINVPLCVASVGWFLAINLAADGESWKPIELSLLVCTFAAGIWMTQADVRTVRLERAMQAIAQKDAAPSQRATAMEVA